MTNRKTAGTDSKSLLCYKKKFSTNIGEINERIHESKMLAYLRPSKMDMGGNICEEK